MRSQFAEPRFLAACILPEFSREGRKEPLGGRTSNWRFGLQVEKLTDDFVFKAEFVQTPIVNLLSHTAHLVNKSAFESAFKPCVYPLPQFLWRRIDNYPLNEVSTTWSYRHILWIPRSWRDRAERINNFKRADEATAIVRIELGSAPQILFSNSR